ncbi:MAG: hypothetical protein JWM95_1059 [Gemmatimonadetes bacterium]|nr:hypothetical protein [Gemmatimonadota bacterium]
MSINDDLALTRRRMLCFSLVGAHPIHGVVAKMTLAGRATLAFLIGLRAVGAHAQTDAPTFERVLPLGANEGVFAYARIAPNGRLLAYASESRDADSHAPIRRTIRVVDLVSRRLVFSEPGIDAYWSNDGMQMIYQSFRDARKPVVAIWNAVTGDVSRDVAPVRLGDYYSWGMHAGGNRILTIAGYYYSLNGTHAELPASRIGPCPGIGTGERPLLSRNGRRITAFVNGSIVVRNIDDCNDIIDTKMPGAKADFSWDGRFIAFHVLKTVGDGYEIAVVDLKDRTVRHITHFSGSSLFPSWTRDGRLSFRYDGDDYRGFLIAKNVLGTPAVPLDDGGPALPAHRQWVDIFPETRLPSPHLTLVLIWSSWSAHAPHALAEFQRLATHVREQGLQVALLTAVDPGSTRTEVKRLLDQHRIRVPIMPLASSRFKLTAGMNQIPTTLLFRDGVLTGQKLGAQSVDELLGWMFSSTNR